MDEREMAVYIEVGQVFPDTEPDYDTFLGILSSLSLSDTLLRCATINLVLSGRSGATPHDRQDQAICWTFSDSEIHAINEAAKVHGGSMTMAFCRGTMLELIRWVALVCTDRANDGATYEDADMRREFAKAALIANDIWGERVFTGRVEPGMSEEQWRDALAAFRMSYEATRAIRQDLDMLARGWLLFGDYFSRTYPTFQEEFSDRTGLAFDDYYACLCAIVVHFLDPIKGNCCFHVEELGQNTPHGQAFRRFLELESQTSAGLRQSLWAGLSGRPAAFSDAPAYDYKPIRERTIIAGDDCRAMVMDPVVFAEKSAVGPLFHLAQGEKGQAPFSAFGYAFEEYVRDILRRVFPPTAGPLAERLVTPETIVDASGVALEADACLNDLEEAVLFEIKGVFVPERDVLNPNPEEYVTSLRERYVRSHRDAGEVKRKGVAQLARAVSALADGQSPQRNPGFASLKRLYPVLVVHDVLIGSPLHACFMASEFARELQPDEQRPSGQLRKGGLSVDQLIVMTIEDIEKMERLAESLGFRDMLQGYSEADPSRTACLSHYLSSAPQCKDIPSANRVLRKKSKDILDLTRRMLFPEAPKRESPQQSG
jgi:hypothetical protein